MKKVLTMIAILAIALSLIGCAPSPVQAKSAPEVHLSQQANGEVMILTIWFNQLVTSIEVADRQFDVQAGKATIADLNDWEGFVIKALEAKQIAINGEMLEVAKVEYSSQTESLVIYLK